jgi:predicted AlkP superfamily pyrophosphatase or phosphodiesterase
MYSTADWTVTPRPLYLSDGLKVFDVHTQPMAMRDELKRDLGPFPFPFFWGPSSGLRSSEWIAESAKWIETRHQPSLSLVYLPHLDYNLQRFGLDFPRVAGDLIEIDRLVGELIDFYEARGVRVVLVSEYGITDVDRPVHLNRVFRAEGWLSIKDELGLETLDLGGCRVFALADHQLAHIYVNDPSLLDAARALLERTPGVERVLDRAAQRELGLDHERAGDLIAIADARSWFTYYYWLDDARAPEFARCVDIHRKCGYDPVELFLDPTIRFPRLKVLLKLLRKKLGLRMKMDLIPLDASLVRGSHGRVPEDREDWPVLIGASAAAEESAPLTATAVHGELLRLCREG